MRLRRVLRRWRCLHVLLLRRRLRVDWLLLRLRVNRLLLHVDGLRLHGPLRVGRRGLAIQRLLIHALSHVGLLVWVPTHPPR